MRGDEIIVLTVGDLVLWRVPYDHNVKERHKLFLVTHVTNNNRSAEYRVTCFFDGLDENGDLDTNNGFIPDEDEIIR